jgi:hypothetical protein
MINSAQFCLSGPPALCSIKFASDYNEIKTMGSSIKSTRTDEQTQIALFWADGASTETPPGHWNNIAQEIAIPRGNTLEENARLFALLNIAADAAICAWDAKYNMILAACDHQFLKEADGNPETSADFSLNSFLIRRLFPTTSPATPSSGALR